MPRAPDSLTSPRLPTPADSTPPPCVHAASQTRSGTRSLQGGCSACKAGRSRSRAVTIAPRHPPVRPTRNTSSQCPHLPRERVYTLRPVTTCGAQGQLLSRARPSVRRQVHAHAHVHVHAHVVMFMWRVRQPGARACSLADSTAACSTPPAAHLRIWDW